MKTDELLDDLDTAYDKLDTTTKSIVKDISAGELEKWRKRLQEALDYRYTINDTKDLYYCWIDHDPEYVKAKMREVVKTAKKIVKELSFLKKSNNE